MYVENHEFIADIHYLYDGDESDEIKNYIQNKERLASIDSDIIEGTS